MSLEYPKFLSISFQHCIYLTNSGIHLKFYKLFHCVHDKSCSRKTFEVYYCPYATFRKREKKGTLLNISQLLRSRPQSFVNLVENFLHAVDIVLWFICQYLTTFSSLNSGQWIIIELNIASLTVLIDNIHSYFPPSR